MPDYAERIRALRALGAVGSGATEPERKLANEKAAELEAKYGNGHSAFTDDTTVTSRDGHTHQSAFWYEYMLDLLRNQYQWQHSPFTQAAYPDPADLVEDGFQADPGDEDYGYDIYEGEDWQ